ncbi:hypothetical protein GJAV_G00083740 [Gymnothorax javanicus]|nr:hypothetical protein GJAV_G00083740 [Gymnothorax javanicus]
MDRQESVYNLIPKKEAKIEKPPRYVSKYSAQVKQEKQMNKSSHKTMGPAKVEAPSTEKFLRKQSKASKVSDSITPFKEENLKKMPMSTRSDNSWKRPQTKKDFIKSNAIDIINSQPRKPQAASVLTKNGDVQLLENSGLLPKFVNKKGSDSITPFMEGNLKKMPMLTRSDNSWKRPQTKKDFIKSNAIDIINSQPRKPQAASVLTKNGDVQLLENSGLLPKFVNKRGSDSITPFKEENLKKMPMSTRSDNSWKRPQTKKDFIKSNAIDIINSQPRKPQAASVLTKNGDVQLLENSGLLPKFVNKKDYGQIPEYMKQRKEMEREQEEHEKQERLRQEGLQVMLEEERLSILQWLKMNLEELLFEYSHLPLVIDTIRMRGRKEKLESQMRQLEKDIDLMERHKRIYFGNN